MRNRLTVLSGVLIVGLGIVGVWVWYNSTQWRSTNQDGPVSVQAQPVPLFPGASPLEQPTVGKLIFRGGVHLKSGNRNFGGLSGFHVDRSGKSFVAITDAANWVMGQLHYDKDGRLVGIHDTAFDPILGPPGISLRPNERDSEGLSVIGNEAYVSFERVPRITRYRLDTPNHVGRGSDIIRFDTIDGLRSNKSLEGLAHLADGSLIAMVERDYPTFSETSDRQPADHGSETIPGFIIRGTEAEEFRIRRTDTLDVTGIDILGETAYILERYYSPSDGLRIRLSQVEASNLFAGVLIDTQELAQFDSATHKIDNFEGISVRPGPDGRIFVYIVSDNNFSFNQKTLLYMFEVTP